MKSRTELKVPDKISFRPSNNEKIILKSLASSWQLDKLSLVLHKILSEYVYLQKKREKELELLRKAILEYDIQAHELYS